MTDKTMHILAGVIVGAGVWGLTLVSLPVAILLAGAAVGIGYEVSQLIRGEGEPDGLDALATLAGAALVAGFCWLI